MGFMDDAKDKVNENEDKVDGGLDKAEDTASDKTGGTYDDKIEQGVDSAQDKTGNL